MTQKVSQENLKKLAEVAEALTQLKGTSSEASKGGNISQTQVEGMLTQLEQVIALFEQVLDATALLDPSFKATFFDSMHNVINDYIDAAIDSVDPEHPELYRLTELKERLIQMC